jgi:L-ascorbate metabolism protein UlaG (beta-lactamase superfamily)
VAGARREDGSTRVTWLGHSTVGVETASVRILTDPVLRQRVAHLRRTSAADTSAVGQLDAMLVSHVHWDHLDLPSLRLVGQDIPIVVPRGAGRWLGRRGFSSVTEMIPGERAPVGEVTVLATHAEHPARRRPWGEQPLSLGFVIEGPVRVYFAGDTDLFPGMAELAPVEVALVPVAGWGRKTGPGHLDPRRAAEALRLLRPRIAIPIHWGTYSRIAARRPDPTGARAPAEEFRRYAERLAPETRVEVLLPGGSMEIDV